MFAVLAILLVQLAPGAGTSAFRQDSSAAHAIVAEHATYRTWTVTPTGRLTSVSVAVALAQDGDSIVVRAGEYSEPVIAVDRSVTIVGEPGAVISGSGEHELLAVLADNVTISGLTFRGVKKSFLEDRSAIRVEEASNCIIDDNLFLDNFFAIYVAKSSGCIIVRNTIKGQARRETEAGNGIHLWYSKNVQITENRISGHRDGIYFEFVEDSRVADNTSENNLRYGLHFMFSDRCTYERNRFVANHAGVAVMYSEEVAILNNSFERNWGTASFGLLMKEIDNSRIERNQFISNSVGIFSEGSNRSSIDLNTFFRNGWAIKIMANSEDNLVTRNNFERNSFDVSTNSRSAVSTFRNNYWDTYDGFDLDHDGFGDMPHRPVTLFSFVVEQYEPALVLLNSPLVKVLGATEEVLPVLTPAMFVDAAPSLRRWSISQPQTDQK
ncbi:MAG: nitrous oxide reductase family maturation protein NosD [Rhodothermales bacterium]